MKINDLTNDSSFIDLSSDEAGKVNGGGVAGGFSYDDLMYIFDGQLTSVTHGLDQIGGIGTEYVPDFSTSGIAGINANVAGILTPLFLYG